MWVQQFLTHRTQKVKVGRELSDQSAVTSGIPQGSILGPVLFTIFINDLPDVMKSTCKIFADDTKLYNFSKNSITLQNDLTNLQIWSETWQLYFNTDKCHTLYLGRNNPKNPYYMNQGDRQTEIATNDTEKDLGVIFDTTLKFDHHITNSINKANKMLGIIRRCFKYLDNESFLYLYKSIVRPHLEYGNIIWYPKLIKQSVAIERIQRRATKMIPKLSKLPYKNRLESLKLPSLKSRRVRGDLIQTYKIFNNIDDLEVATFFQTNQLNITRNSEDKIFIQHCYTNTRKYCFTNRVAPLWNKLPHYIKRASNTNKFKTY